MDQGATFGGITTVATVNSSQANGSLGLDVRTDSFPRAAVNTDSGNLYVVYNDKGVFSNDPGDIFLVTSVDHGKTWSGRRRVNADRSTRAQWQPTLSVTPDRQMLFVAWYD